VPSGALADRFSRRGCLVVAGASQAAGYAVWTVWPSFAGFAVGFALWSLGGALASGAQEALLYEGLAAAGAAEHYAAVQGRVVSAGLVGQIPAAGAATVLYAAGGYALVGWVSVGTCLAAAVVASRLPAPPRDDADGEGGYLATLLAGLAEAASSAVVRAALIAAALVGGFDAFEEYFPLLTADLGVPVGAVAVVMLPIALLGALGAALGGRANRLPAIGVAALLGVAMLLLAGAVLVRHPAAVLVLAVFYGMYRAVLVAVDAQLQQRIEGSARATVTSVAAVGVEISCFAVYAAYALGDSLLVAVVWMVVALALPRLLRAPVRSGRS
jgi:MFS family permease